SCWRNDVTTCWGSIALLAPEPGGALDKILGEVAGRKWLAGYLGEGRVPIGARAASEQLADQELPGRGRVDQPAETLGNCAIELRGHELAEHVVLIVDRIEGEVNLRRPVRGVAPLGTGDHLV